VIADAVFANQDTETAEEERFADAYQIQWEGERQGVCRRGC
jgi:hypothetical protein